MTRHQLVPETAPSARSRRVASRTDTHVAEIGHRRTRVRESGAPPGALACLVSTILLALGGCQALERLDPDGLPTGPSRVGPLAPDAPVRYAALGASDANGVGSSVPCPPLVACEAGMGYVAVLARELGVTREVTVTNLGIPASVLSPTIHQIAREYGRYVPANFVDRQMPFVPADATLVTIFGGPNDVNTLEYAIEQGAGGADLGGYIETQVRVFGADYNRLVRGIRDRAPEALIVILNVPNLAGLPYASGFSLQARQVLQAISVGMSREANARAGSGVVVVDVMCDPVTYDPASFSPDGFHPNDAGHAHLARRLLEALNGASPSPAQSCGQMDVVPTL